MSTTQAEHEANTINSVSSPESEISAESQENGQPLSAEQATENANQAPDEKDGSNPSSDEEQEQAEASTEATATQNEAQEANTQTEESRADTKVEIEEEDEDEEERALRIAMEALVDEITDKLEEPNIFQTRHVVRYVGIEKAREYLEKALEIEEEGGVTISPTGRRRTPGGIFYWLVKQELTPKEIRTLFPLPKRPIDKAKRNAARKARKAKKREMLLVEVAEAWGNRADVIKEVIKSKNYGQAKSIKVAMIGRPGKIIKQKGFIMTTMRGSQRVPSLPKELPEVEPSKLVYLVYIGNKQWKRVAKRIKNPEDVLIIEGYLSYEKALKKMVIFAQMVTTKLIQQERREKQRAEAEKKKAEEAKKKALANQA